MESHILQNVIVWAVAAVVLVAVAHAIAVIKRAFIDSIVTIQRETDMGEMMSINLNLSNRLSWEQKKEKIDEMFQISDLRKAYTFERMQKLVAEEEAKKAREAAKK